MSDDALAMRMRPFYDNGLPAWRGTSSPSGKMRFQSATEFSPARENSYTRNPLRAGLADKTLKIDNQADTHRRLNRAMKADGLNALVRKN